MPHFVHSLGLENAMVTEYSYGMFLLRHGFICIGHGLFSSVYAKPGSSRVIKIGTGTDAWAHYALWGTAKRYAGTFCPKVYSLKFHRGFYVAVMERLVCTLSESSGSSHQTRLYEKMRYAMKGYGDTHLLPPSALKFAQACRKAEFANDLHQGNFMIRANGHLVVIDPCARDFRDKPLYRIKNGYIVQH